MYLIQFLNYQKYFNSPGILILILKHNINNPNDNYNFKSQLTVLEYFKEFSCS